MTRIAAALRPLQITPAMPGSTRNAGHKRCVRVQNFRKDSGGVEPVNYCQSCGKPIVQPRRGGRKRFCDGRCRAAWHRGRRGTAAAGTSGAGVGAAERTATLEWLYGRLRADVERLGVMIEGQRGVRLNPAVAELRRVTVELDRRTPDADDDQRAYDNDLARVLRAVD